MKQQCYDMPALGQKGSGSHAITASGINKFNELIKAGETSDVAYAQARAANNQAFTKFLKTLDWKRPKNATPDIPDIEYMRNDPTIGDIVKRAEKAREVGNRRLFVLLRGENGVRASNEVLKSLGEPPIKTDDLGISRAAPHVGSSRKIPQT
jgi:hypothetical protein